MSRIHPNGTAEPSSSRRRRAAASASGPAAAAARCCAGTSTASTAAAAAAYTVWMRSSMGFQGTDGVSAYDAAGELAFRVDNYSRRPKLLAGELLLMDGRGTPLLSLRPQIISMHDQWNCYRSASPEEECQGKSARSSQSQRLFSVRKCSVLLQSSREAEVYMCTTTDVDASASDRGGPSFWVEGCFRRRSCKIRRGSDGEEVARIARKKTGTGEDNKASSSTLLGEDVFSLVVQPGVDSAMIMALVVVLDRICRRPYTPMICSS